MRVSVRVCCRVRLCVYLGACAFEHVLPVFRRLYVCVFLCPCVVVLLYVVFLSLSVSEVVLCAWCEGSW